MKTLFVIFVLLCTANMVWAQDDEYFVDLIKKGEYRTNTIDVNRDNTQLLIGAENKLVAVYDLASKKTVFEVQAHYQPVISVKFSAVENTFYSVGDRSIKLWKIGGEKPEKIYTGTHTNITSCDYTPGEFFFVASSYDKKYRYWDASQLKAIKTVETGHKKSIIAVAISNDNKLVATGALDSSIEIWHTDSAVRKHLMLAHSRPISCLEFVNKNNHIISASHDGNARLWDAETGEPIKMYLGHTEPISSIEVRPDGKYLLMASFDHTIGLFNIATGEKIHTYVYHEFPVLDVAWNTKGDGFYSCDKEGNIIEWSVPDKVFVDFYFGKEIGTEITASKLVLPRKKGEPKDGFKARKARAEKLKSQLRDKYYLKYLELQKTFVIGN
ncbi:MULTISPECIES: WD40 repeat domain-containing protein [unclassified Saccharicrinis]|uniref:WD40 repeat domain-containing protein n=1 Tax=unclassified Saccharicrinis TaxID=2646859 RepID=UPI003D3280BF